jgi:prepilin-type N-terminal cleavage/methylation domain-containing protein
MPRRGFTLIELLVVICILSILIALSVVGVSIVLDTSKRHHNEELLHTLSAAVMQYATKYGDYPPTSLTDLGARPPNALNNGIETLVACLASRKHGGPYFQKDDLTTNVDGDHADRNLTDWYFGDDGLREYSDVYGNVIIYFHAKDYAKPKQEITRYRFSEGGEEFEVAPELHPATKTYAGPGRFQLRSVGRDGKPGTADDFRPE